MFSRTTEMLPLPSNRPLPALYPLVLSAVMISSFGPAADIEKSDGMGVIVLTIRLRERS